jgi:quercetin dioxygenase-like cupin family protein
MTFQSTLPPQDDPRYTRQGALHLSAGEGVTTWVAGGICTVKVTGDETGGGVGVIEATVQPGGGPAAHVHNTSEEAFYLLGGELEFLDGGRTFTAGAGDFVLIPRGIRHRFRNLGLHPARLLFFFTPAGQERMFIEGGDEAVPGQSPAPWGMDRFARLKEVMDRLDLNTDYLPEVP